MALLHSLASLGVALGVALPLGALLGRAALQWFGGRGLTNVLTEVRAALLPFILVPVLRDRVALPDWLLVGGAVGLAQGLALARWMARSEGEWSPALLGGVALGRSDAAVLAERAASRGVVVATASLTLPQLVTLEGLLELADPAGASSGVGALLVRGSDASWLPSLLGLGAAAFLLEAGVAATLRSRRPLVSGRARGGAASGASGASGAPGS
jgi:hypothetical protein